MNVSSINPTEENETSYDPDKEPSALPQETIPEDDEITQDEEVTVKTLNPLWIQHP